MDRELFCSIFGVLVNLLDNDELYQNQKAIFDDLLNTEGELDTSVGLLLLSDLVNDVSDHINDLTLSDEEE